MKDRYVALQMLSSRERQRPEFQALATGARQTVKGTPGANAPGSLASNLKGFRLFSHHFL